jgi:molybdopterin-guanine dinucleotide biosynthesis protein A
VKDILPDRGALGGLYTALSAANHNMVAILACDMPFVNPDLLAAERDYLVKMQADLVVPMTDNGMEPLHAVYRKDKCLQPVKGAIEADKWRADSWYHLVNLQQFPLQEIHKSDPQLLSFKNVNTPQELEKAIKLAQEIDGQSG